MPAVCQVLFLIIYSNYSGTFLILLWDLLYLYYLTLPGEDAEIPAIKVTCLSTHSCSEAEQWYESGSFCPWKETLKEIFECKLSMQEGILGSTVGNKEENQKEGKQIQWIRVVVSIGNWGFGGDCSLGGPPPLHMHLGLCLGWMHPFGQRKPQRCVCTQQWCMPQGCVGLKPLPPGMGRFPSCSSFHQATAWIILKPFPTPSHPIHGKVVFHETGSWCQKVGDHWAIGQLCLLFLMLLSGSGQQTPPLEAFQPILGDEFHHLDVLFYSSWNTYIHHKHKSVEGKISIWTNEAKLKGVWESARTKQQPEVSLHIQRIRRELYFIFVYWVENISLLNSLINSRNELSLVKWSEIWVKFRTQGLAEIF